MISCGGTTQWPWENFLCSPLSQLGHLPVSLFLPCSPLPQLCLPTVSLSLTAAPGAPDFLAELRMNLEPS